MLNLRNKIKQTPFGDYLLPSLARGAKQELISIIKTRNIKPIALADYAGTWDWQPSNSDLKLCKNTPKGRKFIRQNLTMHGAKILGIGKDAEHAYQDAVKRLNLEYKSLAPNQYANFDAYKWSYLDIDYLAFAQVNMPDKSKIVLIIQTE